MSFLSKLFGDNSASKDTSKSSTTAITVNNRNTLANDSYLHIHQDIRDFLWIGDGEHKNYVPTVSTARINYNNGYSVTVTFSTEEPSLLFMNLPISSEIDSVERPPYYPTYKGLTPEQKGVYWSLLENPYDSTIDIGYVFILYYGLERYLLTDKYEQVIDIIIRLRDVHSNKSFQSYSANAIILTCLYYQRPDIIQKFMDSLDKDYELNFSPDLFLLCKYSLGLTLSPKEVMRMAKAFEFTKMNYIKKYPELFLKALSLNIVEQYEINSIPCEKLLSNSDFKKLRMEEVEVFANISIKEKKIKYPSLLSSFKLKKTVYDLIDKSHEDVKRQLAEMKKRGEIVTNVEDASSSLITKK